MEYDEQGGTNDPPNDPEEQLTDGTTVEDGPLEGGGDPEEHGSHTTTHLFDEDGSLSDEVKENLKA